MSPAPSPRSIGRFAPSPTGPLHFGSLVAALGSFLQARRAGGAWHLRIDDLDPPREQPGAADGILRTLERYGLHWDGAVVYQSARRSAYDAALGRLREAGLIYACRCSRSRIAQVARRGPAGPVYPGTCRDALLASDTGALRLRMPERRITLADAVQGTVSQDLTEAIGDIVLRRADGWHAYALAVVVDDAELGVTEVVRGTDLVDLTPQQVVLQQLLGLPTPAYAHLPAATGPSGQKLSKQTGARALPAEPGAPLCAALTFLGLDPPADLAGQTPQAILDWAVGCWDLRAVPKVRERPAPAIPG